MNNYFTEFMLDDNYRWTSITASSKENVEITLKNFFGGRKLEILSIDSCEPGTIRIKQTTVAESGKREKVIGINDAFRLVFQAGVLSAGDDTITRNTEEGKFHYCRIKADGTRVDTFLEAL